MGRSRYAGSKVLDGDHYSTWRDPISDDPLGPDVLDGVDTFDHVLTLGERLDTISHKYFGDPDYWWVIALANRIMDPFTLPVGQRIRIPVDVKAVLDKVHG
jgi:hypothetical protein